MSTLHLYTPAGVIREGARVQRAARRLGTLGFEVHVDRDALAKHQRFGGDDDTRLAALHRVADAAPDVALATRGGYGMTRLMDRIDWARLGRSVERGTRWVGMSDLTALHLGLLSQGGWPSWAGPLACDDFGRSDAQGGMDDVTAGVFVEAMSGALEAVGFRTPAGHDGLQASGLLWGGNLAMVCSLLGTPWWPKVKGGILFLEDVGEHPYRLERLLLQLHHAGVLDAQKAIVLGAFTAMPRSPLDRGYKLADALEAVRARTRTPLLTGLPFGHIPEVTTKICLPVGRRVMLTVDGRDAFIAWGHTPA